MEELIRRLLLELGEDPTREGLQKTPVRVRDSLRFLTEGYTQDPKKLIENSCYSDKHEEMVLIKDIPLYSLCEHHMLPFFGKAHIAYIPNKKITGLSKIARIVEVYARRMQVQERMTTQIKECIQKTLNPMGVIVVIEAQHLCMQMRGVQKQHSITTTSDFTGVFEQAKTREEFLNLINRK